MKKITIFLVIVALLVTAALLVSCTGEKAPAAQTQQSGTQTNAPEEVKGQGAIKVQNEKGNEISVQINFATDVSQYSIVSSDNYKDIAEALSSKIEEKIGVKMAVSADATGTKAINLVVSSVLGAGEYTIKSEGDAIILTAGSLTSLEKATEIFTKYFVYTKSSTILIPVGAGYEYLIRYYAESITIDGVDISEFSFVKSENDYSLIEEYDQANAPALYYELEEIRSLTNAKNIAEILSSEVIGVTLPIAEKMESGGHYICLSANSSDVNSYSVKIEDGNVYLSGSYLSIDKAAEAFISEVIGYNAESTEYGKTVEITSANNIEGSLGYTAPYNKDELLGAMNAAYNDDDMLIVGNHAYGWAYNGKDIKNTVDMFVEDSGKAPGILELDIGEFGSINGNHLGVDALTDYDLSRIVSECAKFVSEGGIISICAHVSNPKTTLDGPHHYKGLIGDDAEFKKLYTEGTDLNRNMLAGFDPVIRVLEAFDENNIPVIFRPFHEMQGDYFWWCILQGNIAKLQSETWIGLWTYFHNYVSKRVGTENILWCYSSTMKEINYCYPGDEYVDMLGVDWYSNGNLEVEPLFADLMSHGKPVAITEFGPGGSLQKVDVTGDYYFTYSAADQLEDIKTLISRGCKIAYISNWAQHKSLIALEETDVMMNDPISYTQDKLMEYWKNN